MRRSAAAFCSCLDMGRVGMVPTNLLFEAALGAPVLAVAPAGVAEETLGLESAHLAGWSDGALVGVLVAMRRPKPLLLTPSIV